jgi:hypothetical protein
MANEFIIKKGFHSKGNSQITGTLSISSTSSATHFSGDGSDLTNLQRPITTSFSHFTASLNNTGLYFIVGAHTCSIQSSSVAPCPVGSEFEFFQTSSGNLLFATGSGVTLLSKDNKQKLGGTHSGAALKKVAAEVWHLVGNLG